MATDISRLSTALAGRYRIERELGAGGMATVYLAHDARHDRQVALKVLRYDLAAIIGAERFLQEIKTTANLQHPHILALFDSGEVNGTVFYVMPFVEGESLRDRLTREKQLPVDDAVRIARDVADALDYAHRHGVVHRDIKPENILLHDGRAMVADFGIALAVSRSDSGTRMTETGMSLGTPYYMSPEQAMGERTLDARSDVYGLGCVLYEMLVGEPPFTGPTAQSIVAKVLSEKPAGLRMRRDRVPPEVEDAVLTALEKLPADRFGTADEFAQALTRPLDGARATRVAASAPLSPTSARLPWIVAALAIVVAAVAVLWPRPTPPVTPVRFSFPASGADGSVAAAPGLALSPDGRTVVFAGVVGGTSMLFRRSLDSVEARALAGSERGFYPAVSPDGRFVAYATEDGKVRRLPLAGGAATDVVKTTTPAGLSWSARHGIVLGMPLFSQTIHGLSLVNAQGDTGLHVVTRPERGMHHGPLVLPDGETCLFVDISGSNPALGVVALSSGKAERIEVPLRGIVGFADGVLVYEGLDGAVMAVQWDARRHRPQGEPLRVAEMTQTLHDAAIAPNGTMALRMSAGLSQAFLADERGAGELVLPDSVRGLLPRFSPDGRRALLSGTLRGTRGVWVLDFASRTLSNLVRGRIATAEWTSDGKRIVITRVGASSVEWMAADASDSASQLLSATGRRLNGAVMSPDGRAMAVATGLASGEYDIYVRRLDGDTSWVPFAASPVNELAPRFSPDGRWLAYASDESGRYEVYVRPFPGPGARIQLSDGGGTEAMWSRDGKRLYYSADRDFIAVDLQADASGKMLSAARRQPVLSRDIAVERNEDRWPEFDVAPDGKHFLVARAVGGARDEITVWMNWLPELKKRFAAAR